MEYKKYTQFINETPFIRRTFVPAIFLLSFVIPFFKPALGDETTYKMLLVLSCFLLIVIWNQLCDSYSDPSLNFFFSAEDAQPFFVDIIKKSHPQRNAYIIQHSLGYAKDIVRTILQAKKIENIEIYIKHPETALTKNESDKIAATIFDLEYTKRKYQKNVKIYFYTTTPSFRGALVENIGAIAGWYIFDKPETSLAATPLASTQIYGHDTPAFVMRSDSKNFPELSSFIIRASKGLKTNSIAHTDAKGELLAKDIFEGNYRYHEKTPSPYL